MEDTIIINGVTYYREKPASRKYEELAERHSWLQQQVRDLHDVAQQQYDQFKLQHLSVAMVEAEGYLRAAKDMQAWVAYIG